MKFETEKHQRKAIKPKPSFLIAKLLAELTKLKEKAWVINIRNERGTGKKVGTQINGQNREPRKQTYTNIFSCFLTKAVKQFNGERIDGTTNSVGTIQHPYAKMKP